MYFPGISNSLQQLKSASCTSGPLNYHCNKMPLGLIDFILSVNHGGRNPSHFKGNFVL